MIRRRLMVLCALLVMAIAVGACGSESTPDSSGGDSSSTSSTSEADEADEADATPLSVGESGEAGDWGIVVTDATRNTDETGGAPAPASGREHVIATIKLTNNADDDQGTGPVYFTLDHDGTALELVQTSDPEFIFNTPQPIKAGETRLFKIAWDAPADATGLTLAFAPFIEGGDAETVEYDIG